MTDKLEGDPRLFIDTLPDGTPLAVRFPRLLRITDVAEFLRVHPRTVDNWIQKGKLEAEELPGSGNKRSYRIAAHNLLRSLSGNADITEELVNYLDAIDCRTAELT